MIYFVGAGSGAADLITVRGMKLLQEAGFSPTRSTAKPGRRGRAAACAATWPLIFLASALPSKMIAMCAPSYLKYFAADRNRPMS